MLFQHWLFFFLIIRFLLNETGGWTGISIFCSYKYLLFCCFFNHNIILFIWSYIHLSTSLKWHLPNKRCWLEILSLGREKLIQYYGSTTPHNIHFLSTLLKEYFCLPCKTFFHSILLLFSPLTLILQLPRQGFLFNLLLFFESVEVTCFCCYSVFLAPPAKKWLQVHHHLPQKKCCAQQRKKQISSGWHGFWCVEDSHF